MTKQSVFYFREDAGSRIVGPLTKSQLLAAARKGRLSPEGLVRKGEDGKWVKAGRVQGLFTPTDDSSKAAKAEAYTPESSVEPPLNSGLPIPETNSSENQVVFQDANSTTRSDAVDDATADSSETDAPCDDLEPVVSAVSPGNPALVQPQKNASRRILPIVLAIIVVGSIVGGITSFFGKASIETIVARSEASVGLIKGTSSSGTGFLIADGVIATNRHVIDTEFISDLEITFPSAPEGQRGPHAAKLLYKDDKLDLSFLEVNASLPPLETATDYVFRRGQDILIIGSPGVSKDLTLENAISRGVMSTEAVVEGQQYHQLGISINPGNSGGPVLDDSGQVIGIATLKATQQEGVAFSIPIQNVGEALAKVTSSKELDVAQMEGLHRAQVAYRRIHTRSQLLLLIMSAYADSMNLSIETGSDAGTGLRRAQNALKAEMAEVLNESDDAVKKKMSLISTDQALGDSTRKNIVDLWTSFVELKSYVNDPRGSLLTYRAKHHELRDRLERLDESTRLLLGVEVE